MEAEHWILSIQYVMAPVKENGVKRFNICNASTRLFLHSAGALLVMLPPL